MLLLLLLLSTFLISVSRCNIAVPTENYEDVTPCVRKVIEKFYEYGTEVTYVDIKYTNGEGILKAVTSSNHVSVVSRTTAVFQQLRKTDGYIITAGSPLEFMYEFQNLKRESEWRPDKKFLIIIDNLKFDDLQSVFEILLRLSIDNAIVINNTNDPILYTYNPFENYGCGTRFDRIIEKGKCSSAIEDIYFYKYVTGLKNCTFKANSAHWPPFSIDQAIDEGLMGIEEYIVKIFSEREHFKIVHYNYSNDAENYSIISENMSAVGPLMLIQEKEDHLMFGGMLLTNSRADVFDFISVHLSYMDDVRILVKAATRVAPWRNSYLEFSLAVWIAITLVLITSYFVMLLLLKPKDKSRIFFKMCDYFFQHGSKIVGNFRIKTLFLFWIWFAYLISSIYQSSLVGLVTNPSMRYQISNSDDIAKYKLKPCVSPVLVNYLHSVQGKPFPNANENTNQCKSLLRSIRSVSKSEDLYTITFYSVYSYYKFRFYDEFGKSEIYAFKQPMNKVIYAIYLYKGFPLVSRLQTLGLRLRENGFTNHFFYKIISEQEKKFSFKKQSKTFRVIVPWYVLITGSLISTIVFIVELNKKPNSILQKRHAELVLIISKVNVIRRRNMTLNNK